MDRTLLLDVVPLLAQSRPRPQIGLTAIVVGVVLCAVVFGLLALIFRNKE